MPTSVAGSASTRLPSASKAAWAFGTSTCSGMTNVWIVDRIWRRCIRPRSPPNGLIDAAMTARRPRGAGQWGLLAGVLATIALLLVLPLAVLVQRSLDAPGFGYYRALTRAFLDEGDWAQMPQSARKQISSAGLDKALGDVRDAMEADTFDSRLDRHQTYSPLLLDEQSWVELNEKLMEVLEWALEEQSKAAVRIRDEGAEDMRARLLMLTYTGAPAGAKESSTTKRRRAKQ